MKFPAWLRWGRKADNTTGLLKEFLEQYRSKSGTAVNHMTALRAVTAYACARVIAEGLAQVPIKLYRARPGGGRDVARDHPLHDILAHRPNEWQTSYEWRETAGIHLAFAGNEYGWINRIRGQIAEILPYSPANVRTKTEDGVLRYWFRTGESKWTEIPGDEVLHLRGPSWDGLTGLDGVQLAREVIGLSLATEEHGARLFSNGAQPGGILYSDSVMIGDEQRKALRESWESTHGGGGGAHKTAILWGGLKWMSTAQQNDNAQFLETRGFQVEETCRAFRVLPVMVGHSDKASTYASAEQMFLAHVVHTMGPWFARFEQACDARLLTQRERAAGYYVKFSVSALLRGAHEARAAYYSKALGSGGAPAWMTQDEVRELEELNPMGGSASNLPTPTNPGIAGGNGNAAP